MPVVDVAFRLTGDRIPADHGFALFAALCRVVPELHGDSEVSVHTVSGRFVGNRLLALSDRSFLTVRIASDRVRQVLPLAGKALRIGDHDLRVGMPQTRALAPAARLYSRLVIIKGFMEPEPFLEAARRQLAEMDVKGQPHPVAQPQVAEINRDKASGSHSPYLRRTIRIRDREIVGFALNVEELTAEESLRVQERGLGGRRRFGCGVFVPERR